MSSNSAESSSKSLDNEAKQEFVKSEFTEVSVRDLKSNPLQYHNKKIKVGPLKVIFHQLEKASFTTYVSTGDKSSDWDTDTQLEVFYDKATNLEECKNLQSNKRPIIYASGTFKLYIDNDNKGYLQANNVWIEKS